MADLQLMGVCKSFGATAAVQPLNLTIASGELIVLLGPSGAGKTTTLRLVAGLESPDSGQVLIGGRNMTHVAPALRDVTFVFQQYSLYPHLSVYDNLAFPLRSPLRKTSEADIRAKVYEVARMLRMEDKLQNSATKLSGGQMQRVAIARALVHEPSLLVCDEPTAALDHETGTTVMDLVKSCAVRPDRAVVVVTHDNRVFHYGDRIAHMDDGRIVQVDEKGQPASH